MATHSSILFGASLVAQLVKKSACNARDLGSIPGSGRSPGGGHGSPLQHSCLENPMDRGAWRATVHEVARVGYDLATKPPPLPFTSCRILGKSINCYVFQSPV